MNEKNPSTPPARGDQPPPSGKLQLDCNIVHSDRSACSHSDFEAVEDGGSLIPTAGTHCCRLVPVHWIILLIC